MSVTLTEVTEQVIEEMGFSPKTDTMTFNALSSTAKVSKLFL